ncbi:glycosyltransferase family 2 protein [Acidobacteriota bacterium]
MEISVVIPTYNRKDTLEHVLPTLARQTYPAGDYEILLCDSGSTDGTLELVEKMAIPNLRMLIGDNLGRSGARNRGIRESRGQLICFTDADILADPRLLEEHARIHLMEPKVAVVGCEVQVDSIEEYQEVVEHPKKGRHLHRRARKTLSWLFFLTGNASVPKKVLLDVGCFDGGFREYGHEDLDLGYRLAKSGVPLRYHPAARNYHWHPLSFEERCKKMRQSGTATVRLHAKHRDPFIKLRLGINPVSLALHALLSGNSRILRLCRNKTSSSRLCREIVLQYSYLTGCKAALKGTQA